MFLCAFEITILVLNAATVGAPGSPGWPSKYKLEYLPVCTYVDYRAILFVYESEKLKKSK